ncbi:phage minor head protein [Massilia cellulosiltytica]|uniref:phage head morphogenesis protein n=1 Tax=Massilia cellulosiltytica TaxID=2683234 RepID=UPI0039B6AAC5
MPLAIGKNTPFEEQLTFFKNKLNLPTERWDDIMRAAHDRAFVVAGAAKADLLADLRTAVERGIETGSGLEQFRKDFKEIVQRHGWTGWTGQGTAAGEAWRTRIIYQTNTATSYAAGRWQQLNNPKLLQLKPYWKYVHADGIAHPRPLHVSWDGLVLRHDDEFWKTHFPPNGWMCHCRVVAVDARAYQAAVDAGKGAAPEGWAEISPKTWAPVGIDKGFDYAPGARANAPLRSLIDDRLVRLASPIGSRLYQAMQPVLQAEQRQAYQGFVAEVLADPVKRGRTAIVGAIEPAVLDWLQVNKGIQPASAEIAVQDKLLVGKKAQRHDAAGDALTDEEWLGLFDTLANPLQVLYDVNTGKLLYVLPAADGRAQKLAVEFDFQVKKREGALNMIVSAFKPLLEKIEGAIVGGLLQVVK